MLACVCRPVTGSLPKPPPSSVPQKRTPIVVTCEPRIATATIVKKKVPGRPSAAELREMALRQQQQIDSQHQLLAAKEQRLRFLKTQEVRGAAAAAEGERLRRLRERVEAQESKLRRLRALRGQVDLQKTYNVTLSNDLDSIRALFSEKEKELSLAVAKVEALTRQLEDLRRDRRGPHNLISGSGNGSGSSGSNNGVSGISSTNGNQQNGTAARELEKLRRELMYRNQISLQQDARLHLQREALQQRQAELRSVDQRILELQNRLQRKKASNLLLQNQTPIIIQSQPIIVQQQHQIQLQQQQLNSGHLQTINVSGNVKISTNNNNSNNNNNNNNSNSNNNIGSNNNAGSGHIGQLRKPTNIYPTQRGNTIVPRGNNVAAVEPYNHSPKKTAITTPTSLTSTNLTTKIFNDPTSTTSTTLTTTTKNASQLIHDLSNMKLNHHQKPQKQHNQTTSVNHIVTSLYPESDENKLARQKQLQNHQQQQQQQQQNKPGSGLSNKDAEFGLEFGPKKNDPKYQTLPYNTKFGINFQTTTTTKIGLKTNECDSEKAGELTTTTTSVALASSVGNTTTTTTITAPLIKSVAIPVAITTTTSTATINTTQNSAILNDDRPAIKPKAKHQIPSGNLVVPPRKPISTVQPTQQQQSSHLTKILLHNPKVHIVAPNVNLTTTTTITTNALDSDKSRPARPPKPNKTQNNSNGIADRDDIIISSVPTIVSVVSKPPMPDIPASPPPQSSSSSSSSPVSQIPMIIDHLPIKARPLTIKKQPLHEQPRLKSMTSGIKPIQYTSRRIEMPPAFLFPAINTADLKDKSDNQLSPNNSSIDETDKSTTSSVTSDVPEEIVRRTRSSLSDNRKEKLSRRVSFDPLALLLDASLEGELELVRKTAMQVTNPSAANDEGITALHNAICAGHFEIVKFLVEFGCDVNAQDSDGWTPLHCAASCNNLAMVKFLVESGACLFAATLSDHETPAEKCEEDEEGFDGCSEYLYSIQEKLGILNNGEVYAVFSYEQQQSDELSFTVNDRLTILRKGDDSEREWWWARTANNKEGYVPRNLFGLYPRVPLQTQSD